MPTYALAADYGASPMWEIRNDGTTGGSIPFDQFNLSDSLRKEVAAWAAEYDKLERSEYEWRSAAAEEQWWQAGRRLAENLNAKLRHTVVVEYRQPRPS